MFSRLHTAAAITQLALALRYTADGDGATPYEREMAARNLTRARRHLRQVRPDLATALRPPCSSGDLATAFQAATALPPPPAVIAMAIALSLGMRDGLEAARLVKADTSAAERRRTSLRP